MGRAMMVALKVRNSFVAREENKGFQGFEIAAKIYPLFLSECNVMQPSAESRSLPFSRLRIMENYTLI